MNASALVLVALIAWALALLILMEAVRCALVLAGRVPPNGFRPDNENLSPFMQRLARAHLNCLEGLPVFGGLLLAALVMGFQDVTDPLAPWLLLARIVQSVVHLLSMGVVAVNIRFAAFAVQMAIAVAWVWGLVALLW